MSGTISTISTISTETAQVETIPFSTVTELDLVLVQVAAHGWRVCDARRHEDDPHRLLGFVEERSGEFEVMQLGGGFHWSTFATMRDALAYLTRTSAAMSEDRMAGELSWIA